MDKEHFKEGSEKSPVILKKQQLSSIGQIMSLLAAGFIVIIGMQYLAQDIIAPILLAVFLSILLMPLFQFFRKRHFSRAVSVTLMIVTFFAVTLGLVFFLTWSFHLLQESLSMYIDQFKETATQTAEQMGVDGETVEYATSNISSEAVIGVLWSLLGSLGNIVFYFIIIPILSILLIIQYDSFPKNLSNELAKKNANLERYQKFADSIMNYVVGRFKVNIVTGILFTIALLILNIDFPFVWGFLAVIMSFIPYIGLIIAGTPPTLIAFAQYGPIGGLLVIGSLLIINLFAENILDPYIQGKSNKISTAAVVIALFFWTWLFGTIGAILAVPLTVLIKIIFADYRETQWIALLMEGNYQAATVKQKNDFVGSLKKTVGRIVPGKNSN